MRMPKQSLACLLRAANAPVVFKQTAYRQNFQVSMPQNSLVFNQTRFFSISKEFGQGTLVEMKDKEDWDDILDAEVPVILETGADWCGPCKIFKPMMKAAAKDYPNVQLVYMDVDKFGELA